MLNTYIGRRLEGSAAFVEACQREFEDFGFESTHSNDGSRELVLPLSKRFTPGRRTDKLFGDVVRALADPPKKTETVRINEVRTFQNNGGDPNVSSLYAVLTGMGVMKRQEAIAYNIAPILKSSAAGHVNYHANTNRRPEATCKIGTASHVTARLVGYLLLDTIGRDDLELGPIEVITQQ